MLRNILFSLTGIGVLGAALIGSLGSATPAFAHERRTLGKYTMVVGFLGEPAYVGEPNGLDLRVFTLPAGVDPANAKSTDRIGITGLEKTLKAEVIFGGEAQKMSLTLEPRFNDAGAYNGHFFPTATGDYTYHIFGTIEGMNVDESFTSSPEGFSSVEDVKDLQFPKKVPSNEELASQISAGSASSSAQPSASSSSDDDSNTVPIVLAIVGIVVGAVGLAAGGTALARGRS